MFEYIEYVLNDKRNDIYSDNTTDIDDYLMNGIYYRVIVFKDNTVLRIEIKEN